MSRNTPFARPSRLPARPFAMGLGLCLAVACGSEEEPPPPAPTLTVAVIDASDPCGEAVPTPSDLFFDAAGQPETLECPLPSDPVEAAIAAARRYDGAAVDSQVSVPLEGSLDPRTLSSTVTLALTGGSTTAGAGGLPISLLLEQVGTATQAEGWALVEHATSYANGILRMRPAADLGFDRLHVAVLTRAPKDTESPANNLGQSAVVKALLQSSAIAEGAFEGLGAPAAARLERMRQQLQPILPILANASPPILPEDIASIHAFTTERGANLVEEVVDDYFGAIAAGRYGYREDNRVVPLAEVYPGLPAAAYEGVSEYRVGTITAPKLLDDDGRLRADWTGQVETINIPYSLSIPARTERYGVVVFVPGWGRGKLDGRALAPKMGASASSAVLTIDLRCHGDRAMDGSGLCVENRNAQEVEALTDNASNNGNPEFNGADGIPDASGEGFFPGDPRALRDSQIAALIEILHVLEMVRTSNTFGDPININLGQVHLVAQGYMAPAALGAVAHVSFPTNTMTLQLPSAGLGYRQLITGGPSALLESFVATAPAGIDAGNAGDYLAELERSVLSPLDVERWAEAVNTRLTRRPNPARVLLNYGRTTDYVNASARQNLVDTLSLVASRRSEHNPACDDFFLYTCELGDNPAWLEEARGQFATYVSSEGVTVSAPAQ